MAYGGFEEYLNSSQNLHAHISFRKHDISSTYNE
jgi:hypothetical protein